MSWDDLSAFMRAEAPAFVDTLRGVSSKDLVRVEGEQGVQLPKAYRQFVLQMGEDSAGFHLFGPGYNQRFRDVVARLPEQSCPVHEYFMIAYADDASMISPPDHFLDLTRGDAADAPIVMFEGGAGFRRENVRDKGFTFLEQATRRVFAFLAAAHAPERAMLVMRFARDRGKPSTSATVAQLEKMNFHLALLSLPRVSCLRRDRLWILVDVHGGGLGVAINIWSDEPRTLKVVVDQLRLQLPEATVSRPRGSFGT